MHRRTCAAVLLCGPLVAGCGTATRIDFASHPRPATPLEISVFAGPSGQLAFDPDLEFNYRIRPGAVLFDITNQSTYRERFAVVQRGRTLERTSSIASGQTAQIKVSLSGPGNSFTTSGVSPSGSSTFSTVTDLKVAGPPRTGDNDVTQP